MPYASCPSIVRLALAAVLSSAAGLAVSPSAAQTGDQSAGTPGPPPESAPALDLVCELAPGTLDAEALRAALERELALPVRRTDQASGTHLAIVASAPAAVQLRFVRAAGGAVERTVDLSNTGEHATETLALVAANLMRDEAADLLESLRAAQPAAAAPAAAQTPAPPEPPKWPSACDPSGLREVPLGFDILPYAGMSSRDGTTVQRTLSLNLFGGMTGAVRGFELGGFLNIDGHSMCGAQVSGIASFVNGPVAGAQFSLVNWASGRLQGAQFSLVTGALGPVDGAQFGLVSFTAGNITGAQLGLVEVGVGSLRGLQAGLANVTVGDVSGAQIGLVNVGAARAEGLQLGLVNVTNGRMRGAMIGLVNTAADADAAVGLVNVFWKGRTHLDVWGTDFGMGAVGLEHGSRYIHNIYGFGMSARDGRAVFGPIFGLGTRVVENRRIFVDIDAIAHGLFVHESQSEFDNTLVATLRVPVAYRFSPSFAVFVSPAVNVSVGEAADNLLADPSLLPSATLTNSDASVRVTLWPGFNVGARFF